MNYFLEKVGTDMGNIRTEVEKLSAYTLGRDVIEVGDVDAICTEQITGQIFKMMDQIAMQNVKNALVLYHDLLLLREKPMHVLNELTSVLLLSAHPYARSLPELPFPPRTALPPSIPAL